MSLSHALADGVCTITLDEPGHGNRFTLETMRAFIAALRAAHESGAVVLLLRAEGDDFTLGRDASGDPKDVPPQESLGLIIEANELLTTFPGPSIALVQGRALGFGTGLALGCDITLAADDATFGFPEVLHGLAPLIVVDYLPDHVGRKVAAELYFTGRDVPAAEAHALRIANRLVPADALAAEGEALIAHLRSLPVGALRLMKRFALDDAAGRLEQPGPEGVARLAAWLQAGKPDEV